MTTFLIIGAAGVVLVLFTLIVGDVLDGALGLDALDNDLFSISSLAAFIGAFGFGGALALSFIPSVALAVVVGLVIGATAAWGAVRLTRALRSGDDGTSFRQEAMLGHAAHVITPIPVDGYGEIRITVAGHVRKMAARSAIAVDAGTEVWVSAILSPTAVEVTATHALSPDSEPPTP